jgi:thiamine-phosphate pyrophosphorylase
VSKLPRPPLLIITDRSQARAPLEKILADSFSAGCRWASVREKDLPREEQVALAKRLLTVARDWDARLTLHGSPVLAQDAALDGVHLPAGANASVARAMLGSEALIGISIHRQEEAKRLDPALVDYAIAGPAFASMSKPEHGPVLGMLGIGEISRATSVPIIAIGGITAGAVAEMHLAGAVGVAVMGGVMRAQNPAREVENLIAALQPET